MKLIRELAEGLECIEEATASGGKQLYISGVFLQAGITNRNGRMYPPAVLEREVARYVKEKVDARCAYGELGHPNTPSLNPDRISHVITELKRDAKNTGNWIGKAAVIDEGMGKIVGSVMRAGGRWGISSRGLGTLHKDQAAGCDIVNDDYRLMVGGDIVTDPSAPDAWLNGIMEHTEWFLDESTGEWRQRAVEAARKQIKQSSVKYVQENKAKLFESFIESFTNPTNTGIARLAKAANVSEDRVCELYAREIREGMSPATAGANVRRKLGL